MRIKLMHDIILGDSQLGKLSNYTHDVKEHNSACSLAKQYMIENNSCSIKNNSFTTKTIPAQ